MPDNKKKKINKKVSKKVPVPGDLTEDQINEILQQAESCENVPVNRGFKIPQSFLNQLSEFSNGGYILFSFDTNGTPKQYEHFDSDMHNLSMHNYIKYYSNCMENIHENITMGRIMEDCGGESEEDNE